MRRRSYPPVASRTTTHSPGCGREAMSLLIPTRSLVTGNDLAFECSATWSEFFATSTPTYTSPFMVCSRPCRCALAALEDLPRRWRLFGLKPRGRPRSEEHTSELQSRLH